MTTTRSSLRQVLQDKGFSYREARILIKSIMDTLIERLKAGRTIEFEFGTLKPIKPQPKRQYRLGKIVRTYTKPKVHFKRKD